MKARLFVAADFYEEEYGQRILLAVVNSHGDVYGLEGTERAKEQLHRTVCP